MNIGIDFDNTLINYKGLFYQAAEEAGWNKPSYKTKSAIKQQLIDEDGNDLRWQFLQKEVYAHHIDNAIAFDGVYEFIKQRINCGDRIYIISHKTQFSNLDGETDLISPALKWLFDNNFIGNSEEKIRDKALLSREQVFFCETRERKIQQINRMNCDVFIDDLQAVLTAPGFLQKTLKIFFSKEATGDTGLLSTQSWYAVQLICKLKQLYSSEFVQSLYQHIDCIPEQYQSCQDGGNHTAFMITGDDCAPLFVKTTSVEQIDKLENESNALKLLRTNGIKNVPDIQAFSRLHGFLTQHYIDGKKISLIKEKHLSGVIRFIQKLENIKSNFPYASQCRLKLSDYTSAIDQRLENIETGLNTLHKVYPELQKITLLIEQRLKPLKQIIEERYQQQIKQGELNAQDNFPAEEMILNPSDFGFHNMLLDKQGKLFFLDFEYFGWDDKVKLVSDFIHHQGHKLSLQQQLYFIKELKKCGFLTTELLKRLYLVIDFIGLEWVLIVLNIAQEDKLKQKITAFPDMTVVQIINSQYDKANCLLDNFYHNYRQANELITLGLNRNEITG